MRRADRLFQIIQLLRVGRTVTAAELGAELEVSERTIYRDVRDLMASGVAIEGEAGVGYVLRAGFDLPPLMFTEGEIEALVAGARMVEATADVDLARQARSVVSKAESILPAHLRDRLRAVSIHAPSFHLPEDLARNMEPLRRAIADGRKVRFDYATARGEASERVARPLGLYFWGRAWTSACWCELRQDFRSFRLDRMERLTVLPDPIPVEAGRDLATFLQRARAEPEIDES